MEVGWHWRNGLIKNYTNNIFNEDQFRDMNQEEYYFVLAVTLYGWVDWVGEQPHNISDILNNGS